MTLFQRDKEVKTLGERVKYFSPITPSLTSASPAIYLRGGAGTVQIDFPDSVRAAFPPGKPQVKLGIAIRRV